MYISKISTWYKKKKVKGRIKPREYDTDIMYMHYAVYCNVSHSIPTLNYWLMICRKVYRLSPALYLFWFLGIICWLHDFHILFKNLLGTNISNTYYFLVEYDSSLVLIFVCSRSNLDNLNILNCFFFINIIYFCFKLVYLLCVCCFFLICSIAICFKCKKVSSVVC